MKRGGPLARRTPLVADADATLRWRDRSRKPLPTVGRRARRERPAADAVRPIVWERDGGRCQFPHHAMPIGCEGRLELCHVIPKDLAPAGLRWHPDNLFVGCAAGNAWAETNTGEAFATGRHGHMWDRVKDGKVVWP